MRSSMRAESQQIVERLHNHCYMGAILDATVKVRRETLMGHRRQPVSKRIVTNVAAFPPQFWLLMGGTLIYAVGVDMCYPFETLYLNGALHVPVGTIGLILGVVGLVGLPFQFVAGSIADLVGRRGVLMVGICGSMTLYIGLGLAHMLSLVVFVFLIEAAFGWSMFITASNAMVADLIVPGRRGEAFGIGRTAINLGMIGGPLIALVVLSAYPGYRVLFVAAGGVNQQTAGDFIRAGATAIGVGTELIPRRAIQQRDAHWISELARRFLSITQEARVDAHQRSDAPEPL